MPSPEARFRAARPADAHAVAMLHADSWRRHYRGAYSDAFLDWEASEFLDGLWTQRLATPGPQACTLLAETGGENVIGLVHAVLEEHPVWGAFVDNLHVHHSLKRQGVGRRLMAEAARTVRLRSTSWGLHLWVLEQNTAALAFYAARGGKQVERAEVPPPGGVPARLKGRPYGLRIAWPDAPPCACAEQHSWQAGCQATGIIED